MTFLATSSRAPLRSAIPAVTILAAILLDLMPIPHAGPTAAAPLLTLCSLFFWLVYRPSRMDPAVIFFSALLLDAWSQLPLGLTSLSFLAAFALLMPKNRSLSSSPFAVVWMCFAIAAAVGLLFRWILAGFWLSSAISYLDLAFEWLLTVLFYPLVGHLLAMAMAFMPKVRHASGR